MWCEIAASRPSDTFDPGAQVLLESFCVTVVHLQGLRHQLERLCRRRAGIDDAADLEQRIVQMNKTVMMLATKLRLTVQSSVEWHSRKIGERGQQAQNGAEPDTLLGGEAVWGGSRKRRPN